MAIKLAANGIENKIIFLFLFGRLNDPARQIARSVWTMLDLVFGALLAGLR